MQLKSPCGTLGQGLIASAPEIPAGAGLPSTTCRKGGLRGSSLPVQGAAPSRTPFQGARIAFRGKRDAAPAHGIKSSQVRPGPPAGYASLVLGEASVGRSLRALRDGRQASSAARCRTIENDTGVGVTPRRAQRKSLQAASCEASAAAARSVRMPRADRPCCHTVWRDLGDDAG